MSKELIERMRSHADAFMGGVGGLRYTLLEAADALEAKAAPAGEREAAIEAAYAAVRDGGWDSVKDMGIQMFQAGAAYQRQVHAEHEGPDYGDGPEFEGWAERSGQQPQSAEAFQKVSVLKDCNVRYSITTAPQPSAGVVMPERKRLPDLMFAEFHESRGWNACLDEFARLNGKEVGRG